MCSAQVRADSAVVISALTESAHSVAMVTGDAPLTAYYVAHTLGMCDKRKPALLLSVVDGTGHGTGDGTGGGMVQACEWRGVTGEAREALRVQFKSPGLAALAEKYELLTTEDALEVPGCIPRDLPGNGCGMSACVCTVACRVWYRA